MEFLRSAGVDVLSVAELGWVGRRDAEILSESVRMKRFVLTHDGDFGRLAVARGQTYHGIPRLRPGDDPPALVIESIREILARDVDWTPPLIAVCRPGHLRIRRRAVEWSGGRR